MTDHAIVRELLIKAVGDFFKVRRSSQPQVEPSIKKRRPMGRLFLLQPGENKKVS
jgi:hypothetical protein